MTALTASEDTMIFFAVNKQYTNLDFLIGLIDTYIQRKQEKDNTDRFNFVAYEANGPISYEDFVFDRELILNALNDIKESLAVPNLAGGIFVSLTNIIEVFKTVSGKAFRLVVLMDQGTRLRNSPMLLESIMTQVIDFPVFLDFVRINTEEIPIEDVELIKFAQKYNGMVYFARSPKDIPRILDNLLKKKELKEKIDKINIPPEKTPFFDNLGADLWIHEDTDPDHPLACQICRSGTGTRVKCPQCQSVAHPDCLAMWAKMSNIGLPYLFRCMSCYQLQRLPADFVKDVQSGEFHKRIKIEQANQAQLLREKEEIKTPALVQAADAFAGPTGWEKEEEDGDLRIIKDDTKLFIQFCECGAMNLPEATRCSQCGKKFER